MSIQKHTTHTIKYTLDRDTVLRFIAERMQNELGLAYIDPKRLSVHISTNWDDVDELEKIVYTIVEES